MDNCGNCRFLKKPPLLTKHEGQCRRNPPTAQMIPNQIMTFYPVVKFTDWCGEFKSVKTLDQHLDEIHGLMIGGDHTTGSVRDNDVIDHGDGTLTFKIKPDPSLE